MGVRASTLTGRAVVDDKLKHVTQWQGRRIDEMLVAHEHDLGGRFALGPRHAAVLLSTTEDASAEIFALMDTDHNDLVDAFEVMATFITLSGITIKQKIDVLHGLFDFSRTGELSVDELTIFMRCVATGCAKVDPNVVAPTVAELEKTARWCFKRADRSLGMELAKEEFNEFVLTDPSIKHFLDYFSGASRQVPLAPEAKWIDKEWRLYLDAGAPLPGMPGEGPSLFLRPPTEGVYLFGATLGRIKPGLLENAGFLSAVAVLATTPNALKALFVPTGQEDPHGRFACRFRTGGREAVVCVDDLLVCGSHGKPLFASTHCENLWLPLLEKAFIKLRGSCDAACAASTLDVLRALTGDAWEELGALEEDPWDQLKEWTNDGRCGLGCVRQTRPPGCGIVSGRAYGVVRAVEAGPKRRRLVQFGAGWVGPLPRGRFHGTSALWDEAVRKDCNYKEDDGTFWLELDEVTRVFDCAWRCRAFPDDAWVTQRRADEFVEGGGCFNQVTWVGNPQFFLDLPEASSVQLTLAQTLNHALGLCVVKRERKADADVEKVSTIKKEDVVGLTERFVQSPEVDLYLDHLAAGAYAIIPMTLHPVTGKGGAVSLTSRARMPHTLRSQAEILARAAPAAGTSAHDVILLAAPAPPAPLADGDQEATSVAVLYGLVGDMWVEAFALQLRRDALRGRYEKLRRIAAA